MNWSKTSIHANSYFQTVNYFFQGYEYFGYDTQTYFNTEHDQDQENCSYIIEDGQAVTAEEDSGSCHEERSEKPLEIDLDRVSKDEEVVCKSVRNRTDQKQILCK